MVNQSLRDMDGLLSTGLMDDYHIGMPRSVLRVLRSGYDPSLGRFIQPDTLVPRAANSQAWNRYAYVGNNPVNATDPTGHCSNYSNNSQTCNDFWKYYRSFYLKKYYGITFGDSVDSKTIRNTLLSARIIGEKLAKIKGGDALTLFRLFTGGEISINFGTGKGGDCQTVNTSIVCNGSITLGTITHEFIHVFDKYYTSQNKQGLLASNYFPVKWVSDKSYQTWGYLCGDSRCMSHWPSLKGYDYTEAFANLGENWFLEGTSIDLANENGEKYGFKNTDIGNELRNWMDVNIPVFLDRMG